MPRRVGPYGKLLANYAADDAIIAVGEAAELLFCRAIAFLSTSDSDGFITDGQLGRVVGAGMRDAPKRAAKLAEHGLWIREEGGYQVRSYLKINESAEEKGRARSTDRERKRHERDAESGGSPNGHAPDNTPPSERSPEGVTPDSLTALTLGREPSSPVKSSPVQSSAGNPRTALAVVEMPTAQTIIGEWIDHAPKRPPQQVIGQTAKAIAAMLAEGIDPDDVRRGLAAWMTKGLHPSTLPSVVNEVMNATPQLSRSQRETDDLFDRAARRMGVIAQ